MNKDEQRCLKSCVRIRARARKQRDYILRVKKLLKIPDRLYACATPYGEIALTSERNRGLFGPPKSGHQKATRRENESAPALSVSHGSRAPTLFCPRSHPSFFFLRTSVSSKSNYNIYVLIMMNGGVDSHVRLLSVCRRP